MSLDKQKIINELGSVVNQLQSADCGCMSRLFNDGTNQNHYGDGHMCNGGHCGWGHNPCAGEPHMASYVAHCNPPKLIADTYNYYDQHVVKPAMEEVYNELKSITPENTVVNHALASQMGIAPTGMATTRDPLNQGGGMPNQGQQMGANMQGGQFKGEMDHQGYAMGGMQGHGQVMNGLQAEPLNGEQTQAMGGIMPGQYHPGHVAGGMMAGQGQFISGMPGHNQGQPMNGMMTRQGEAMGGMVGQNLGGQSLGAGQGGIMAGQGQASIGMAEQMHGQPMAPMMGGPGPGMGGMTVQNPSHGMSVMTGGHGQPMGGMSGNQGQPIGGQNLGIGRMPGMNPQQITQMNSQPMPPAIGNQRSVGKHAAALQKFNEVFPGVMSGDLAFNPMEMAIKMNPDNTQQQGFNAMKSPMMVNNMQSVSQTPGSNQQNMNQQQMNQQQMNQQQIQGYMNQQHNMLPSINQQQIPNQQQMQPMMTQQQMPSTMVQQQMPQPMVQQQTPQQPINQQLLQQQMPPAMTQQQMNQQLLHQQMPQAMVQQQTPQQQMSQQLQQQMPPAMNQQQMNQQLLQQQMPPAMVQQQTPQQQMSQQLQQQMPPAMNQQQMNQHQINEQQMNQPQQQVNYHQLNQHQMNQPQMLSTVNQQHFPSTMNQQLPANSEVPSTTGATYANTQQSENLAAQQTMQQSPIMDPIMPVEPETGFNTLGQPVEMVPGNMYRRYDTGPPQPIIGGGYSNVKNTISKTSIMGHHLKGSYKTPSRSQLQHLYNQYKGSQSFTQQNVQDPKYAGTASDGKLDVMRRSLKNQNIPLEREGGDTAANNEINHQVKGDSLQSHKVEQVMGDELNKVPKQNNHEIKRAEVVEPTSVPPKRCRNGLQDMTYTTYSLGASWTFHGSTPPRIYRPTLK